MYDYYFNLDLGEWSKFSLEAELSSARSSFNEMIPSQKRIENLFVPTHDTIRHKMVLECLITNQVSTLVIGPGCSGRSALLRHLLFDQVFEFTKKMSTDHVTMS